MTSIIGVEPDARVCVLMWAINYLLPNFLNNGIDIINFEWLTQWFLNSKSDQILLASRHIGA